MNSDDRSLCIVSGFICAMIVAVIFLLSSCHLQESRVNLPLTMLQEKLVICRSWPAFRIAVSGATTTPTASTADLRNNVSLVYMVGTPV